MTLFENKFERQLYMKPKSGANGTRIQPVQAKLTAELRGVTNNSERKIIPNQ